MAAPKQATRESAVVLKDRASFKTLLAKNPNHFGNLEQTKWKAAKKVVGNTSFEQATCVGFNPQSNFLEATIAVKRPSGYGGDLCHAGSTEYVRFFLDYGSGWEDVGLAAVQVHDIPNARDCAGAPDKPITYVASLRIDPHRKCCKDEVLPRVRAILSWQWAPPAGNANANWKPVWGNVLECAIQIAPRPWSIFCLLEEISVDIGTKLEIPKLFEEVQLDPIPLPDPPPFELAQLAELYTGGKASKTTKAAKAKLAVEPHRFGLTHLQPLLAQGGFNQELFESTAESFKAIGVDLSQILGDLEKTSANVAYEELECLGLDEGLPERLVATFRIKQSTGYSGNLCSAGSKEYVAFWADWDDTCDWTYLGTVAVNTHDLEEIPGGGLCYSAILPVDLTHERRSCKKPKIGRVRAVLSWAVPPSTTDPDKLEYWGNRLDAHVQIAPGDSIPPGGVLAAIRNLGGIAIEDIDTAPASPTAGLTIPTAIFAHHPGNTADGWGLGRRCPFGGNVQVEGNFFFGYWYRVKVRKATDPPMSYTVLGNSFLLERAWSPGYDLQTSVGGFFKYADPLMYFTRILAEWGSGADGLWEVQLDISTAPNEASIVDSSPWYAILIDNTGPVGPPAAFPTMDVHISAGGDCMDFVEGVTITGDFIANDAHFGAWSLSTLPNTVTTPSNPPQPVPFLAGTSPAPGPGGHGWSLNTASPVKMKPCGYVVHLNVWDRSIVNSYPGSHNGNSIDVGLCLRAKP
jgi:hypothetical protein